MTSHTAAQSRIAAEHNPRERGVAVDGRAGITVEAVASDLQGADWTIAFVVTGNQVASRSL
jgi:hypothetical protein